MDDKLKNDFLEFERIKMEIKELSAQADEIKERIQDHVPEDEKINCEYGSIERKSRPKWTYSEETTDLADELKERQKEEQAKGIAINNPTVYIEYRANK